MDGDQLRPRRSKRKVCLETSSKMDDENSTKSTVDDAEFTHDGMVCRTDEAELCSVNESCATDTDENTQNKISASETDLHVDISDVTQAATDFSKGEAININGFQKDMSAECLENQCRSW